MNEIEEFLEELERKEAAEDMHFSTFYIPPYYQPQEENDKAV